jgi:hypothetical protein
MDRPRRIKRQGATQKEIVLTCRQSTVLQSTHLALPERSFGGISFSKIFCIWRTVK